MDTRIANTKYEVKSFESLQIKFEYDKNLLNTLYQFHVDIGAAKELPVDKKALKNYLIRLHETITVKNPIFPDDVRFDSVYGVWMMAVVYEVAKRHGNNISALARCFNDWFKLNASEFIVKEELTYGNRKSRTIQEFTNVEISRLYDIIEMINKGDNIGGLFNTGGAQSFCARLKKEYEQRELDLIN